MVAMDYEGPGYGGAASQGYAEPQQGYGQQQQGGYQQGGYQQGGYQQGQAYEPQQYDEPDQRQQEAFTAPADPPAKSYDDPYGYGTGLGGYGSADGLREMDSAVGLAADAPEFDFSRARATSQQMYDSQLPDAPPVAVSPEEPNSPPSSTGVDPRHYKTRLCVYLGGGGCPHGARCFFAHSQDELRPPAAATCAEYKTRPCRYSLAECPFAAAGRCQFAHSLDELRQGPPNLAAASPERLLSARRFKTRLCKYFMAGHCPYAVTNTCQFAHSNDELRAPRDAATAFGFARSVSDPEAEATARRAAAAAAGSFDDVGASPQAWPPPRPPPGSENEFVPSVSPVDAAAAAAAAASSGAALRAALEQKRFTKLCKYFIAGHCPFEATGTCQFAHSTRELRKRSPPRPGPMIPPRVPPPPISTSPALGGLPPKSLTRHPAPFNTQGVQEYGASSPFASQQSTPQYPAQSQPRDFPSRGSSPRANVVSFGSPATEQYYGHGQTPPQPMPGWGEQQRQEQPQNSPDPWANSIDARTGAAFDSVRALAEPAPARCLGEPPQMQRAGSLNGGLNPLARAASAPSLDPPGLGGRATSLTAPPGVGLNNFGARPGPPPGAAPPADKEPRQIGLGGKGLGLGGGVFGATSSTW